MANLARALTIDRNSGSASGSHRSPRDIAVFVVVLALLIVYPIIDEALGFRLMGALLPIGIYTLLAMGLNIVVGYAGLLDLGYAAFFAIGAYTVGFLTSPASVFVQNGLVPVWLQQFWPALVVACAFGAYYCAAMFGRPWRSTNF